ncbi:alpha/beta hydrolase fold domain-containing protein [Sediminibacillus dalangtanensis]|uniref:Alpha/beta hydrolase fold domain-containing protein n=1 Tax=Sediminibacillus dalangtanensis TaxID=2729421 RepID=A0ABX7VQH1_9BACI|nr:alpha/beta hydrolase [Sediminibacillus dalangtanensis]QTM98748.1 alpha/beta hydrolase fold domain-containing protein [Sediminibacillus dalangtanensis]
MRIEKQTFGTEGAYAIAYLWEDSSQFKTGEKRPAVVICPGGGYTHTSDREADPVAMKYFSEGYHVITVRYSCISSDTPLFPDPYVQLGSTFLWLRSNAENWHVDLEQIVLTGFSAGGHLALTFTAEKEWVAGLLGVSSKKLHVNHLVLCYPVVNFTYGWPKEVEKEKKIKYLFGHDFHQPTKKRLIQPDKYMPDSLPRTFIWHTRDDATVPVENSMKLMLALQEKQIPHEAHFFESGVHGLSLGNAVSAAYKEQINPYCEPWFDLALNWLKKEIKQ